MNFELGVFVCVGSARGRLARLLARPISRPALIALIDEAVSVRRPATESEARGLFNEARILLAFEDADEMFNDKFQKALQTNADAVLSYNDARKFTAE